MLFGKILRAKANLMTPFTLRGFGKIARTKPSFLNKSLSLSRAEPRRGGKTTLEFLINVALRLLILGILSRGYALIWEWLSTY